MKNFTISKALLFLMAISILSCKKDGAEPERPAPKGNTPDEIIRIENERLEAALTKATITAFLSGTIMDEDDQPLSDVKVYSGSTTATTDEDGFFTFGEISLNESYALIQAEKTGFFKGFRTFVPTENALNTVSIQLMTKGEPETFDAQSGSIVNLDEVIKLDFPENSIATPSGQLYTGTVTVRGRYIDPNADNFTRIMPGSLSALNDENELGGLESYGMINVELMDQEGNDLEIAPGKTVQISMPAPADGPDPMPLWHFNETYGIWVEAGSATKEGNVYTGSVNHFSLWNCDVFSRGLLDCITTCISIQDENGNPLANLRVEITSGFQVATVYTDDDGRLCMGNPPENITATIMLPCKPVSKNLSLSCFSTNEIIISNEDLEMNTRPYSITGSILDCNNEVFRNKMFYIRGIDNEYIFFGGLTDDNGNFDITTILCSIDENISETMKASVILDRDNTKDKTISLSFTGNEQTVNLDFCDSEVGVIPDDFEIPFEDENFEKAVRREIKYTTGTITYRDVKSLTKVVLHNVVGIEEIQNISGIQFFHSLVKLSLPRHNIRDLSLLAGLKQLNEIDLRSNNITDITALSGLENLTKLELMNNNFSDISSLSGLSNLIHLDIEGNEVTDIKALANLKNLTTLRIGYNVLLSDIRPLSGLTNLTFLRITNNNLSDISPLSGLTNLTDLNLRINKIADVSPLSGLKKLKYLDLEANSIKEVSPLCDLGSDFEGLIILGGNEISSEDMENLKACLPNANL